MTVTSSIMCGRAHPHYVPQAMLAPHCVSGFRQRGDRSWRVRADPGESAPAGVSHRSALSRGKHAPNPSRSGGSTVCPNGCLLPAVRYYLVAEQASPLRMDTKRSGRAPRLQMPAVQQRRDFVEKEGVEVAHMGEAPAGQHYSEQWASPALGSTIVDQVVDIILTTTPTPADLPGSALNRLEST
jgi:hypothetical protein